MRSTIRLFKAVPVKNKERANTDLLKETIKSGFLISPEIICSYSKTELSDLVEMIREEIGLTSEQLNQSFHKSWNKVKTARIEQLVLEQIVHYITTYGLERLGIYDKDSVYIPSEKLEIPELREDISLIVIKGHTKEELKKKLLDLLNMGVALGEDTIKDVIEVALFVGIDDTDISQIKNKEVRICLYTYMDVLPKNPVEFLRLIVFRATESLLLIKNTETIEKIKARKNLDVLALLFKYEKEYGLEELSSIFYRFKPLWLAFKTNVKLNSAINRIRKLAKKHHKPMEVDYLNAITAKIKGGEKISKEKLLDELNKVNCFRKVRLAYALRYRIGSTDSILYRIRNGKSWATDFSFIQHDEAKRALDIVLQSVIKDVAKNVKGKKIYIPDFITYSLPATEKQFTGYFPSGTFISIPKDMVFGVHWDDVRENRIDLDLSLINVAAGKIGWDSSYRTDDRAILFSGDITDAREGASELFYVQRQIEQASIMMVNFYNYSADIEVPFKIIIAKEQVENLGVNYMINPNNVIAVAQSSIQQKQKMLGLLVASPQECKFYFAETGLGMSITSYGNKAVENARKYLFAFYENAISLNEVLERAGAKMVSDKEKCDIDLSPEKIEKDTILKLVT